jgi:hypothetical protein
MRVERRSLHDGLGFSQGLKKREASLVKRSSRTTRDEIRATNQSDEF